MPDMDFAVWNGLRTDPIHAERHGGRSLQESERGRSLWRSAALWGTGKLGVQSKSLCRVQPFEGEGNAASVVKGGAVACSLRAPEPAIFVRINECQLVGPAVIRGALDDPQRDRP